MKCIYALSDLELVLLEGHKRCTLILFDNMGLELSRDIILEFLELLKIIVRHPRLEKAIVSAWDSGQDLVWL